MIDIGVASPSAHGHAMISTDTALSSACAACGGGPDERPDDDGRDRDRDDGRHEPAPTRDPRAAARARAMRCASRDQPHDLREQRVAADALGAHRAACRCRSSCRRDAMRPSPSHRDRLAREQRLVDVARAVEHDAVDRHVLARTHAQRVADRDGVEQRRRSRGRRHRRRCAIFGASSSSARIAPEVCARARSSSTWPSSTSVTITAADSK